MNFIRVSFGFLFGFISNSNSIVESFVLDLFFFIRIGEFIRVSDSIGLGGIVIRW